MTAIEKIDRILEERGMTTRALADMTGISENRISKWRQPKQGSPSNEELVIIADCLHVARELLLDPTVANPPEKPDERMQIASEMIKSLDLPKDEVIRRLSGQGPTLRVATPIAEHRGEHGTPADPGSSLGANRKYKPAR